MAPRASAVAITVAAGASTATNGAHAGASGVESNATSSGAYHDGMAVLTVAKGGLMYAAAVAPVRSSRSRREARTDTRTPQGASQHRSTGCAAVGCACGRTLRSCVRKPLRSVAAGPTCVRGDECSYFTRRPEPTSTYTNKRESIMGRGILLWMLGVPLPIILLLAMCSHH